MSWFDAIVALMLLFFHPTSVIIVLSFTALIVAIGFTAQQEKKNGIRFSGFQAIKATYRDPIVRSTILTLALTAYLVAIYHIAIYLTFNYNPYAAQPLKSGIAFLWLLGYWITLATPFLFLWRKLKRLDQAQAPSPS